MGRRKPLLAIIVLCLLCSCMLVGIGAAADSTPHEKKATSQKADPSDKANAPDAELIPDAENSPVPLQTEAIDEAGENIGKKIDEVGKGASRKFGAWVNAKAFLGISWLKLIVCVFLLLLVVAVERLVRYLVSKRIRPEDGGWWSLFFDALAKPLSLFIRIYGIYWALSPLLGYFELTKGHNVVHDVARKAADVGGTIAVFWFVYRFVRVLDTHLRRWAASTNNSIDDMLVPIVGKTLRITIISMGGIMIVQNMTGIDIGPLIASLGIGGLAFALAGKDSIANFLGSLTILLDKPFQVGERILIDSYEGVVENVGFRSTRLRTPSGSIVSIPNEKIINSTLENIGRRSFIRWNTNLTLTCDTPPEKVERAVAILLGILADHEGMQAEFPPRVFFNGFNDWSLNVSINAWYHPADPWLFQAWVQRTCLEIMRRFRDESIEFAFPTQTVYQIDSTKQLELRVVSEKEA